MGGIGGPPPPLWPPVPTFKRWDSVATIHVVCPRCQARKEYFCRWAPWQFSQRDRGAAHPERIARAQLVVD